MADPTVTTETNPGGGTRTTMSYSDGTKVQVTKGENGTTATKTTSSTGKNTTVWTDKDGNQTVTH